jgi:ubiquinone biosynthesis protein
LEQALLYGFFHGDPHPANIFVQKNGKVVFLDFGIVGQLSTVDRKKIIDFIKSLPEKNPEKSIDIFLSLAKNIPTESLAEFKEKTTEILEGVYTHEISKKGIGQALYEIVALGGKYDISFDSNHVLVAKALYQAEGIVFKLDPSFKIAKALDVFRELYLKETFSPLNIFNKMKKSFWDHKDVLLEFPEHLQKIIRNLEKPQKEARISSEQWKKLEDKIEVMNHKRSMGLMVIVLFVAAVFFFYAEGKESFFGIPFSNMLLIFSVFALGYLMWKRFWRREEQSS